MLPRRSRVRLGVRLVGPFRLSAISIRLGLTFVNLFQCYDDVTPRDDATSQPLIAHAVGRPLPWRHVDVTSSVSHLASFH